VTEQEMHELQGMIAENLQVAETRVQESILKEEAKWRARDEAEAAARKRREHVQEKLEACLLPVSVAIAIICVMLGLDAWALLPPLSPQMAWIIVRRWT
jgi:hypothetical protein